MRVIVCGMRDWSDEEAVVSALKDLHARYWSITVVEGGAAGADRIAATWVKKLNNLSVRHEVFPADWEKDGRSGGPIRNARMADAGADLCLAFWDGNSKGTADMIRCAVQRGIEVRIVPKAKS